MRQPIINLAQKLIAIESTKEKEKERQNILTLVEQELPEYTSEYFDKNSTKSILFYKEKKRPKKFKVILNAHLDVVHAKINQFTPYIKDGKLFGRGADDMKAAAAVEILVFKELAKKLPFPIALQLVTDEEIGGFNGTKFQIEKGVRADFVVAGEPTSFQINNKTKGIIWIQISVKGKSAHGAYLWNGKNAILEMKTIIDTINKKFPVPKKEEWKSTVNISSISTENKTFNKVPDECSILLDVRFIPSESETIIEQIQSCLTKNSMMNIVLKESSEFTEESNEYITLLKSSAKKVLGKEIHCINKHGGSDMRHYINVKGKAVSFGPVGGGLHTDNEWVDIKSLEQYYEILKFWLQSIK